VLAVLLHPFLLDQAAVTYNRNADARPAQFRLAVFDEFAHKAAAVPDERLAARKIKFFHAGFRQHGQPALRHVQRQHERRLRRVEAKSAAVIALAREMVIHAERYGWLIRAGSSVPRDGRCSHCAHQRLDYAPQSSAHHVPRRSHYFKELRVLHHSNGHRRRACSVSPIRYSKATNY